MDLEKAFAQLDATVQRKYPLSELTSFRVGGPCDYLVRPATREELREVVRLCYTGNIFYKVMGRGTNLLVRDGGIRGVVIHMGSPFAYWSSCGEEVTVGAAHSLPQLVRELTPEGLSGLEFAAGIPGTVGGGLFMNAGAYRNSLSDLVKRIAYLLPHGEIKELTPREAKFAYRWSSFKEARGIILEAVFQLRKEDSRIIEARVEEIMEKRRRRQPTQPSAGSVFRNPPGRHAGRLIEAAGGKGMQVGGARVSEKHANFIVNTGGARASDILKLVEKVRQLVKDSFGIVLEMEVEVIGED